VDIDVYPFATPAGSLLAHSKVPDIANGMHFTNTHGITATNDSSEVVWFVYILHYHGQVGLASFEDCCGLSITFGCHDGLVIESC
jgi:hypothetical protein